MAVTIKAAASIVTIGGAVVYLLGDSLLSDPEALSFMYESADVLAKPNDYVGKRFRIHGYVDRGSIFQKPGTNEWRFRVTVKNSMQRACAPAEDGIDVEYEGIVPDTFKNDAELVASGKLVEPRRFVATQVVAKCPSKHEAETAGAPEPCAEMR